MHCNILLVDDDPEFRAEFKECFSDLDVITAADGKEALDILSRPNEIELVLLDVVLPCMKGTEVLKRIKATRPDVKVIMLTGYGSKDAVLAALRGKADDFAEKPINVAKLQEMIRQQLSEYDGRKIQNMGGVNEVIERVRSFMVRNIDKNVKLKDAAAVVSLSPKYLSRIFKEKAGYGFNEQKIKLKIEMSKEFLTNTGYNISEISYKTGYQNIESFIRVFKRATGKTPSEYRAKHSD